MLVGKFGTRMLYNSLVHVPNFQAYALLQVYFLVYMNASGNAKRKVSLEMEIFLSVRFMCVLLW